VLDGAIYAGFAAEVDAGAVIDLEAGGGGGTDPVEVAKAPQIGEADEEHAEEEEHVDDGDEADVEDGLAELCGQVASAAEGDGPGIEEGDFDIEDEENEGDDVEAKIELDPAGTDGWLAAFVDGRFFGVGHVGADQGADGEVGEDEDSAEGGEDGYGEKQAHRRGMIEKETVGSNGVKRYDPGSGE
jgi:hypothetical protein